jgi:hypothetical protein
MNQASFRLKVDSIGTLPTDVVVTIDVFDFTSNLKVAERAIQLGEFFVPATYRDFNLSFTAAAGHVFEFRTYWHDRSLVTLDKVTVDRTAFVLTSGSALHLADGQAVSQSQPQALSPDDLAHTVDAALLRLASAGLDVTELNSTPIEIANLPGLMLSYHDQSRNRILIDSDAAGSGWFIDRTPLSDEEFDAHGDLVDAAASESLQPDLLTAVLHEFGHELGLTDQTAREHLMSATLSPGTRHTLDAADVDQLFASVGSRQ